VDVSVLPYILRCVDVECLVGIHRDQHLSDVSVYEVFIESFSKVVHEGVYTLEIF